MSGHLGDSNTSQPGPGSSYPAAWSFPSSFNPVSVAAASIPTTSPTAGRPSLLGGTFSLPPTAGPGRYGAAARPTYLYESSPIRRRHLGGPGGHSQTSSSSARDRRAAGDPERKRVVVACLRCRKRKIRCSGDDGVGGACSNCKNASEPQCLFMRVQAGSVMEMKKREQDKRIAASAAAAAAATASTFTYDLDACRQYQSRGGGGGGASVLSSAANTPTPHSTGYTPPTPHTHPGGAFGGPTSSGILYGWTPGSAAAASGGGYDGHGASPSGGGGGAGMAYGGLSYHGMPYHGMPSPDASYMGENDLMDRPATTSSSMADAGAFALQSMSQGLPTSSPGGYPAHPAHGHSHGPAHGMTPAGGAASGGGATPRSLHHHHHHHHQAHPGPPPTVLGSSRGVPASAVFSGGGGGGGARGGSAQQYPSPATTPVTSGVSPAWSSGYEHAHHHQYAAAMERRLPGLYSAAGPAADGGSQHDEEEAEGEGQEGGGETQQHYDGYEYGDAGRGQPQQQQAEGGGGGEEQQHPGRVDMVVGEGSHAATAPGSY